MAGRRLDLAPGSFVGGGVSARGQGMGFQGPTPGRFRFGPTGQAFNPYSKKVQDEIIRTSGGLVDERNIDDLVSTYMDDLYDGATPQEIVDTLRQQAAYDMQHGGVPLTQRDVEYVAFAELMARQLTPMQQPKGTQTMGLGGGGNPLEALAEPGRRIAGMLRSIDRGLRPANDPRVIQPTIAAGNMKRPKTGQAALEAMRNPEATIPAMSDAARRAEDASTFEFMRQNQISSAGQNNAQAIQGYRNNLQARADAAPNANRLAETAAVEIKQAQQQAQKLHGDLVDAIIADDPQAQRMAAESLAGVKMQIEMMKRNAPKKQRENLDRVISIIDVAVAEGMKARQQPGYVARTLAGPGLKKLQRDGETLALLTDPARAKDAYRIANEVKPLGSWEKTGQATALGATVGAGALAYDQTQKAEARKQEDYYARRDAWDVKNKHIDNYAPKKLEDVQSFLNAVVPAQEGELDLVIDGRWGENTSKRIKRYQKMRGLTVNGRLTWETITDLEAEMNAVQR